MAKRLSRLFGVWVTRLRVELKNRQEIKARWLSVKLRKIISIFLAGILLKTGLSIHAQTLDIEIFAESVIMIDSENGQVLYKQDEDQILEVGSVSKLLAAYMALKLLETNEDLDFDSIVPISDAAFQLSQDYDLSNVPLRQDYQYTVNELIEAIAINLANGATLALADFLSGSEAAFVDQMSAQLNQWGVLDYQLVNATGLAEGGEDGPINQMSAEAVAIIAYHLVNDFPHFLDYSQKPTSVFKPRTTDRFDMNNYNQMLKGKPYEYDGVLGLMPGSDLKDKYSFAAYAERNEFGVITVVLGTNEEDLRYEYTASLLDYAYSGFMKELVVMQNERTRQIDSIEVESSEARFADLAYGEDLNLVVPIIDTTPRLEYKFTPREEVFNENGRLEAPMAQGDLIGQMAIKGIGTEIDYLSSTKGNNASVVLGHNLEPAAWYLTAWRSLTSGVSNVWESTRRFFVDIFN